MKRLREFLADFFWPQGFQCLCCDALSEGELLCSACHKALQALKLGEAYAGDDRIRSVFRYDGVAKRLVLLLKEQCVEAAAEPLAADMAEATADMKLPPDVVLTWVSMPKRRYLERGIDHGRLLCEAVGRRLNLPVQPLLERTGKLHTQRGLTREERLRNLSGSMTCNEEIKGPVLLIDDVLTTGATASACAETLMRAGAPAVYVLTATRVMLHSTNNDQKG